MSDFETGIHLSDISFQVRYLISDIQHLISEKLKKKRESFLIPFFYLSFF